MKFSILALVAAVAASPLQRRYGDLIRGVCQFRSHCHSAHTK